MGKSGGLSRRLFAASSIKKTAPAARRTTPPSSFTAKTEPCSDNDDDNQSLNSMDHVALFHSPSSRKKKKRKTTSTDNNKDGSNSCKRSKTSEPEIIDLLDSDDENNNNNNTNPLLELFASATAKAAPTEDAKKPAAAVKVKAEGRSNKKPPPAHTDVQVMDAETFQEPLTEAASSATGAGDLEVVGTRGTLRLPHSREHCTEKPFQSGHWNKNQLHCDLCYCYCCDCPVAECQNWTDHCMASDKNQKWVNLRINLRNQRKQKEQQEKAQQAHNNTLDDLWSGFSSTSQVQTCLLCKDNAKAYISNFANKHDLKRQNWCNTCGRLSKVVPLGGVGDSAQGKVYEPRTEASKDGTLQPSLCLGTKTLEFTLHAHDPRDMELFRSAWNQKQGQDGWNYDAGLAEENLFKAKVGPRPLLESLLALISPLSKDKIPKDATQAISYSETDAMILDNPQDIVMLADLYNVADSFGTGSGHYPVSGDISATWDKDERKGRLTLRVYLNKSCHRREDRVTFTEFLGSWFGIFPFKIDDLAGRHKAKLQNVDTYTERRRLPVPPFDVDNALLNQHREAVTEQRKDMVDRFNAGHKAYSENLKLGSGSGQRLGGVCTNEVDFEGAMRRLYKEILADKNSSCDGFQHLMGAHVGGAISTHRSIRSPSNHRPVSHSFAKAHGQFRSFLSPTDHASWSMDHKRNDTSKISTLDSLMSHMVNLGHDAAEQPEGLKVDLLPFQLQSLQWALQREQTGLEAFLWVKLPVVAEPGKEVWFSPILGVWQDTQPKLVRGGFIAEMMGLGKTVISLALILKNPAPLLPESGSKSTKIPQNPDKTNSYWDPETKIPETNPKRGRILSQGTLVICNVSLVGQWIEEAKSKLEDPGLIHCYHGSNRKRDPHVLSKFSIVVTTYETLVADDSYWRNKSSNPHTYCSPCESIRWWRVIADECHNMRATNNSKADTAKKIVGEHKWLVSGTPVSSTLNDLKHQLQFLGLHKNTEYFTDFKSSVYQRVSDRSLSRREKDSHCQTPLAPFCYFMRTVMMRHVQSQTYKGTKTTLMSLPPMTERTLQVKFNKQDRDEYQKMEAAALSWYRGFRSSHGSRLSSHVLALMSRLSSLRIACSGGAVPLESDAPLQDDDDDEMEEAPKQKKVTRYSDFTFTSKLNALLKELQTLREDDPNSKSLIFSNHPSSLEWLQRELPNHGFSFRTLKGSMSMRARSKALQDFQNDPPTTVFLLSLRSAACGINLTQANNVFLLEPCLNPSTEKQAIGRVHRLGQTRKVRITRLVVPNTVESRLGEMLKKKYGVDDTDDSDEVSEDEGEAKKSQSNDSNDAMDEEWTCPCCMYSNSMEESECTGCGGEKPASLAKKNKDDHKMPAMKKDGSKKNKEKVSQDTKHAAAAGSLKKDKVEMAKEEFDLLFGYEEDDNDEGAASNEALGPSPVKSEPHDFPNGRFLA